jgi:hypothetical protein
MLTKSHRRQQGIQKQSIVDAVFAELPAACLRAQNYAAWGKTLVNDLSEHALDLHVRRSSSAPTRVSEGFSYASCLEPARTTRCRSGASAQNMRRVCKPCRIGRACAAKIEEKAQLTEQKMNTAVGGRIHSGHSLAARERAGMCATAARC